MLRKLLTSIACIAAFLAATSAFASTTYVHEYTGSGRGGHNKKLVCQPGEYSYKAGTNTSCVLARDKMGDKCFKCSCDKEKFPWTTSNCPSSQGFKVAGTECSLGSIHRWSSCECDAAKPAYSPDDYNNDLFTYFKGGTDYSVTAHGDDTKNSTAVCYIPSGFSCKSGNPSIPGGSSVVGGYFYDDNGCLKYAVQPLFKNAGNPHNFYCATGVSVELPCTENPESNCTSYLEGDALYWPKRYYWYTACSDAETNCVTSEPGAGILYDTININRKDNTSITCYRITGCATGLVNGYIRTSSNAQPDRTYFQFTATTVGTYTCYDTKACQVTYSQLGISSAKDEAAISAILQPYTENEKINYNINTLVVNNAYIACYNPIGCKVENGYYDTTCNTDKKGCWDGKLKWFVQP